MRGAMRPAPFVDDALDGAAGPSAGAAARTASPAACHMPLATAIAATGTAMEHAGYGNGHPHTAPALPFVVGHAGGINTEGMLLFGMCRDAADNNPNARQRI